MKKIPLTQNKYALVDDDDYEYLSQFKWHLNVKKFRRHTTEYAKRAIYNKETKKITRQVYMHRDIMDTKPGLVVDHINHNGLDNQKGNLRVVTRSQNGKNARPYKSGLKGIKKLRGRNMWSVYISSEFIGKYKTKREAAIAYNNAAKRIHGEFAYLNEI